MSADSRYTELVHSDGPDYTLLMCKECSTRSTGVIIPADEREEHDAWHVQQAFEEGLEQHEIALKALEDW